MINLIGWTGAVLFALCGLPEFLESIKIQDSPLTWGLLLMWFFGEVLTLIYVVKKGAKDLLPLIFNYGLNIFFLCGIIGFKVYGSF